MVLSLANRDAATLFIARTVWGNGKMSRRIILISICVAAIAAVYLFLYRPNIAPWVGVIRQVNKQMQDNPEFEDYLDNYAQIGASGGSLLKVVEAADPIIGIMDEVDSLLDSPATAVLGLAGIPVLVVKELISTISDGLQELVLAKRELDDLAQLQSLAEASRTYRDHPNEQSLRHLVEISDENASALGGARQRLAWLLPKVDPLNGAMHSLLSTLDEITERSIPGVSDVAKRIHRFLQPIAVRLDIFADGLHTYQSQMNRDISTMNAIGSVATRVEDIDDQNDIWFKIALKIAQLMP